MRSNFTKQLADTHPERERRVSAIRDYPPEYIDSLIDMYLHGYRMPKVLYVLSQMYPECKPPSQYIYDRIISMRLGRKIRMRGESAEEGSRRISFTADPDVCRFLDSLPSRCVVSDIINSILLLYVHRLQYEAERSDSSGNPSSTSVDRFGNIV